MGPHFSVSASLVGPGSSRAIQNKSPLAAASAAKLDRGLVLTDFKFDWLGLKREGIGPVKLGRD
jgi:hypothetical protein